MVNCFSGVTLKNGTRSTPSTSESRAFLPETQCCAHAGTSAANAPISPRRESALREASRGESFSGTCFPRGQRRRTKLRFIRDHAAYIRQARSDFGGPTGGSIDGGELVWVNIALPSPGLPRDSVAS